MYQYFLLQHPFTTTGPTAKTANIPLIAQVYDKKRKAMPYVKHEKSYQRMEREISHDAFGSGLLDYSYWAESPGRGWQQVRLCSRQPSITNRKSMTPRRPLLEGEQHIVQMMCSLVFFFFLPSCLQSFFFCLPSLLLFLWSFILSLSIFILAFSFFLFELFLLTFHLKSVNQIPCQACNSLKYQEV